MNRILAVIAMAGVLAGPVRSNELETGFATPPDSAKPDIWWHWMNGSITKAGITADLEAMARVGIGSAQIFNLGATPPGPVKLLSPEWHAMVKHAGQEAARLGLKLSIHNCSGWSSSGGPWNTPANAMQHVTISETNIIGPAHFSGSLPQPPKRLDYYRDIEVLAFRTPAGEDVSMKALSPKVTASVPNIKGAHLFDGNAKTFLTLPLPGRDTPQFIQLEFAQPFAARSALIKLVQGIMDVRGVIQVSADGQTFRDVQSFAFPQPGASGELVISFGNEPVLAASSA